MLPGNFTVRLVSWTISALWVGSVQRLGADPSGTPAGNTLQVRGQAVCASIKGMPFEPCFNLDKQDDRSFRGSVSGMGFAYCDFRHQGASQMLMARSVARPRSLLRHEEPTRSADARADVSARVQTPPVESAKLEPVKDRACQGLKAAPELRRSTD